MSETTAPGPGATPPPPPPSASPPGTATRPPLRRSRDDRTFGGVAGGLAAYFGVDPVLVRIAFVVAAICGAGIGLVLYVACLVLIPDEDSIAGRSQHNLVDRHGKSLAIIAGVVVIIALGSASGPFGFGWGGDHGPWGLMLVLLAVGGFWIVRSERQNRRAQQDLAFGSPTTAPQPPFAAGASAPAAPSATAPGGAPPAAPEAGQPTAPYGDLPSPSQYAQQYAAQYTAAYPTQYGQQYPTAPYAAQYPPAPGRGAGSGPYVPPEPVLRPPKERSSLGLITLSAAMLVAGVLVGIDQATDVSVPAAVVFASSLLVVSLGLLVGAVVGRGRGLIVWAVMLAALTSVTTLVHFPSGQMGDIVWAPRTVAEVQPDYRWGLGEVRLDLSAVRPAGAVGTTEPITTKVALGVGDLRVVVPRDATVELTSHVGAGAIVITDGAGAITRNDGFDRSTAVTLVPVAPTVDPSTTTTFRIDASIGLGQLEVTYEAP
jgi:phage shock protein PspC (stress-responsive transcriptional regulator)